MVKKITRTYNLEPKTSVKPLAGYVLIEPAEAETKTSSGIILPENAQEKPSLGTVLACGESLILENGKTIGSPVKPGDKVYFKKWGSDDIKIEGKELKLVKFDDLMAIVE
ncbi:MAG: co-chaperone GroES [Candidatus Daviesbacteria bacterium]|nr:co-chaperone GroES [Candidatus Daviesbacteria bacterium]